MLIPEETHLGESRRIMTQRSCYANHRISAEKVQSSGVPRLPSQSRMQRRHDILPRRILLRLRADSLDTA